MSHEFTKAMEGNEEECKSKITNIGLVGIIASLTEIRNQLSKQDKQIEQIRDHFTGSLDGSTGVDDQLKVIQETLEDHEQRLRAIETSWGKLMNPRIKTVASWISAFVIGVYLAVHFLLPESELPNKHQ